MGQTHRRRIGRRRRTPRSTIGKNPGAIWNEQGPSGTGTGELRTSLRPLGAVDLLNNSLRDSGRAGRRQRDIEFDENAAFLPAANRAFAIQRPRALTDAGDAMAE